MTQNGVGEVVELEKGGMKMVDDSRLMELVRKMEKRGYKEMKLKTRDVRCLKCNEHTIHKWVGVDNHAWIFQCTKCYSRQNIADRIIKHMMFVTNNKNQFQT